jgi:hypothetical protein
MNSMSVKSRKQIASRRRNAPARGALRARQAKYDAALKAYVADRKVAQAAGTKMPNMGDYVPAGGF